MEVLAELLEQVKAFVDRLGQAQLADQQVDMPIPPQAMA